MCRIYKTRRQCVEDRRPKTELVLTDGEREQLRALTLRGKTAQALALRALVVMACYGLLWPAPMA